jgi:hypothetical protein
MHSEYASNPAAPVSAGELFGAGDPDPPTADAAALAAGVVSWATLGPAELLLQPLVTNARQAAAAISVNRDLESMSMLGFLLGRLVVV